MASLKARTTATVERLRARFPWFAHLLRSVDHYGSVYGNAQAGAVTYFGFLSVFPILALAFFVVGRIARVYPDARDGLVEQINTALPGLVGDGAGQISLTTVEDYAGTLGLIGLVILLYAGLGWLSAMRLALEVMFVVPRGEHQKFVRGKLRDLATLAVLGLTLLVSVVISGAVNGFSGLILDWVGIDKNALVPQVGLSLLGHALAMLVSASLLMAMFQLLVDSHASRRALVEGALLGAVGFELLKLVANLLIAQTKGSPAFQIFGVALILVVWINYFSRLVMYSAAWAYTAPGAVAERTTEAMRAPGAASATDPADEPPTAVPPPRRLGPSDTMGG